MEEALLVLESRPEDGEALGEIFRTVHTLKGDSATVGFKASAAFAHQVEDLLDILRSGEAEVTPHLVTLLLRGVDVLRDLLRRGESGGHDLTGTHQELLAQLTLEVESQTGEIASDASSSDTLADALGSATVIEAEVDGGVGRTHQAKTLRVDLDKLDQLLTMVGEVAVARGQLTQMLEDESHSTKMILETHREGDRLHMDVQELVMKLRMVPVGPSFQQYARTVRDLSLAKGKLAVLHIEGGDVEVDNSVLQLLKDPVSHMIRNALDHGIEQPAVRVKKGKPPKGTITLSARHVAGSIVIELSDDGKGLDRGKILAEARSRGLIGDQEEPSDFDLFQTVFEPGFSTAEKVTDLSGRGVGMDVVRRNIEALRGTVEIDSPPGHGTRVVIRLPLTLAIIEGLLVRAAEETFIVPLDSVVESLDLPMEARSGKDDRGVISVRGRTLPWVRLRKLFDLVGPVAPRENLVVVQLAGREAGLVVDEVFGKSQTVIKPLAKIFQKLPGISGSAILGNGRVALILDVPGLLRREVEREVTTA
ncbi:MAG: chemotaxis protein CheA, partial [Thermoanaerobaculia bacterium]